MSGRAIILIVAGIIVISSVILYRIEAASSNIVANSAGYYKKQTARNIAQSGVNLSLRQLENYRNWRTGFTSLNMLTGKATVSLFDTVFAGVDSVIGIRSVATLQESTVVSTAYAYFPPSLVPVWTKGLVTLNSQSKVNGNINIDGRDHDPFSTAVNAGKGSYGVSTSDSSFTMSGSATVAGTLSTGVDVSPTGSPAIGTDPAADIVLVKQKDSVAYPTTPDSVMGGPKYGFNEGTLKSIAKSGVSGSQYTTNPGNLRYPVSGITYVDLPAGGSWSGANIYGSGILIVHNSAHNANLQSATGNFSGIIISDDVTNFHGSLWGALISLTKNPSGNLMGNGSANLYYSKKSILRATNLTVSGTQLKVIAWWE